VNESSDEPYKSVASAPSIVIPPPFAAEASTAPLAIKIFLSSTLSVEVLSCVWVPSIVRLPVTIVSPVTVRSEPSNVRLPLSSISPLVPASTTLPLVKSCTLRDDSVDC